MNFILTIGPVFSFTAALMVFLIVFNERLLDGLAKISSLPITKKLI